MTTCKLLFLALIIEILNYSGMFVPLCDDTQPTIMCFYPRLIKNRKYSSYKIKKGDVPIDDWRKLYVPIGCGKCYECKRQKAQQWKVRLTEELKVQKYAYYITLTFSDTSLFNLCKKYGDNGIIENNGVATDAVRLFLERWRKRYKKSVRHWLITEMGHEGTERIHIHGILFPEFEITPQLLGEIWQYGRIDIGLYCNLQTINYIVKYVTKVDVDHKNFEPIILCSAGLGSSYVNTWEAKQKYIYRPRKSIEYYTLSDGRRVSLPTYMRNKLYTQAERDKMWTERLDKQIIYVNRIPIDVSTDEGQALYLRTLKEMQEWNKGLGYGDTSEEWQKLPYNITLKELNQRANEKRHFANSTLQN